MSFEYKLASTVPGLPRWRSVSRSVVSNSLQPHESHSAHQASLSITNSRSLLKPISIESVMPSKHMALVVRKSESISGSVFVTPWILFCQTSLSLEFSFNKVDETGACYTEWSKSERERQILYINAYISNFKDGTDDPTCRVAKETQM